MQMSYWRFAAMIATSTLVMFGLMYLNTYAFAHVRWSETRLWMALLMGASMAMIMLSFMLNMYANRRSTWRSTQAACWSSHSPSGWCAARRQ